MKSNVIILFNGASMTGTVTLNSNPIRIDQIYGFAVQAEWTGTPTGAFKLQASCDSPPNGSQVSNGGPDTVTNWTDIANSSYSISGSAGNYMWNFTGSFYNYVRLVYTNTSGSGSLKANLCLKGV